VKDLTGQRFGIRTIIERAGGDKGGSALWLSRCDCGNETRATVELGAAAFADDGGIAELAGGDPLAHGCRAVARA
jgi:hypothetical protein